ncbi:MAG TPA: beta-ketoacyl synthase chain length factor [Puia sp.]|nr:beta-ketoacyl synthase chain length factor [Puia sp.]
MFYFHHINCISPQKTFSEIDLEHINTPVGDKLLSVEPAYEGIPLNILRRMGKAVRMGVGAALKITRQNPDGIIIGTANGGMEDCIKFLNQVIDYNEGMLTPTNFVQSTTNAIASQIGLMSANKGYNCTHVHRGLAFENALLDTAMLLRENHGHQYLLGGIDEISAYNYNIEFLEGCFKKEKITGIDLYKTNTAGTIAGEGSVMFLANNNPAGASGKLIALRMLHCYDENDVAEELKKFIRSHFPVSEQPDVFFSGENGDNRLQKYYDACEQAFNKETAVVHFKHVSGEYATVSAFAAWLACHVLQTQKLPMHFLKYAHSKNHFKNILVYNNYRGLQHSFMLISAS